MTKAVCLQCGELKFGALLECPHCRFQPDTPESQGQHVLATDHYHSINELEQIGAQIKAGESLSFNPEALAETMSVVEALAPRQGGATRRWPIVFVLLVVGVVIAYVLLK